jgi:iron(III) transport system substrate-binding protein
MKFADLVFASLVALCLSGYAAQAASDKQDPAKTKSERSAKQQAAPPEPPPELVQPPVTLTMWTSFDSSRLEPIFAEWGKGAGVKLEFVSGEADLLLGRLLREGPNARADLVLLPSAARLDRAAIAGLLQPVDVPALNEAVPQSYRDPAKLWYGVASFARGIATSSERVKPGEVGRYDDLAKPDWKGKLCLPPLNRPGNRTLFAAILFHDGPDATAEWMRALAGNEIGLTPDPSMRLDGDDHVLVKAIAQGKCDVAIVGSRTLARLADRGDEGDQKALGVLRVVWPEGASGVPIDVVGVGVAAASHEVESATKFLAFLASDAAQRALAETLWAYPIKAGVPLSNPVTRWGPFKADPTPLATITPLIDEAGALAERSGWK